MTRGMYIQDDGRKVRVDRETWQRVQAYFKAKGVLWDEFAGLGDNDPAWNEFNARRNAINVEYRDILGTPEYRLMMLNEVRPLLERMAGNDYPVRLTED